MAYAEICTCIRTLQEAAFQQESEIFRLREREAQLKLLVKDLCEKLHGATGPRDSLRNGSVTGLEQSRDILNNESNSLNCRPLSSTGLVPSDAEKKFSSAPPPPPPPPPPSSQAAMPPQHTSGSRSNSSTPTTSRREHPAAGAPTTASPRCDRKQYTDAAPPATALGHPSGQQGHPSGQQAQVPAPSPLTKRRTDAPCMSPRQQRKTMCEAAPAAPPAAAVAPQRHSSHVVGSKGLPLQPQGSPARRQHGTTFVRRGSSSVEDPGRRRTLFSTDMETTIEDRIIKTITLKYGDMEKVTRAAVCIQRAYHAYVLRRHYATLLKQGPALMRQRTSTLTVNKRKRLSIMADQEGVGTKPPCRAGAMRRSDLEVAGDPMARMRERSNLHRERPITRRGQLIKASTVASVETTITTIPEVAAEAAAGGGGGGRRSVKRGGVVYADGGANHQALERSQSSESLPGGRVTSSVGVSSRDSTDCQEKPWKPSIGALQLQTSIGIHQFNRKPTTGIQYLVSKGLLEDSPLHVARFLHERAGLSKQRIGEFLGEIRIDFNMAVLEHMTCLIDMKNMPIDEALREFQKMFLMPGEAQKIDKIMQTFASEYFKSNKGLVENEDAAYVLSFAIMMLHTSLHNPSVKHKTSVEQWVTMNRGNNGGKDFPKQFLLDIYERIRKTPFATGADHTTQVVEIQQQLVESPIHNLANPQRSLVLKAVVFELDSANNHWLKRKQHKRLLLIFNDLVIVAKKGKDHYVYKSSFPLFSTAAAEISTEAAQCSIQIYSLLDKKILLQCSSETEEEHTLLIQTLCNTINMLGELEKARIAGLVTTLDQTGGNSKHLSIGMEDCDRLSSANQNSQQQNRSSISFIVGVGDIEGVKSQSTISL